MAVGLEQFVKSLEDSGIITPSKLRAVREKLPSEKQHDAQELARELVRLQKLTKFQAQEAYQGKAKSLVLGNYLILDKIGAGGMGQVYKAEHRRMKRIVAIKMLPRSMMKDAAAAARFQREVEAAARLQHPNIVAAHDADESHGIHFLVMEYVEGSDLSALVKKNGPFAPAKAVDYITQAARGLEAAHAEGIVHRDIKPANLLLDKRGVIKILDMGLARLDAGIGGAAATQAELTSSGQIMGTVDYMSPEQAFNTKLADARADIYSLGCTLYYLLTGKPLYGGESIMEKLLAHREKPIPPLAEMRDDVPAELEAVVQKMLAKNADERYQTMTDVIADLVQCASESAGSQTRMMVAPESSSGLSFLKDISPHPARTTVNPKQEATQKATASKAAARSPGRSALTPRNLLLAVGSLLSLCLVATIAMLLSNGGKPAAEPPGTSTKVAQGAGENFARDSNGQASQVDLFQYVDPTKAGVDPKGKIRWYWAIDREVLASDTGNMDTLLPIDYSPPPAYVLDVTVVTRKISGDRPQRLSFGLASGKQRFSLLINMPNAKDPVPWSGLSRLDDKPAMGNETGLNVPRMVEAGEHAVRIEVRPDSVIAFVDGEKIVDYHGANERLTPQFDNRPEAECDLWILIHERLQFTKLTLTPLADHASGKLPAGKWALKFDGVENHVLIETMGSASSDAKTIEAYVTPARIGTSRNNHAQGIVALNGVCAASLTQIDDSWAAIQNTATHKASQTSVRGAVIVNRRMHLASVWDGTTVTLYIDGRPSQEPRSSSGLSRSPKNAVLGVQEITKDGTLKSPFAGLIDAVRISHTARYTQAFQPEANLAADGDTTALYRFDEGQGEVLKDSSGNEHHGRIVGAKWIRADTKVDQPPKISGNTPPSPADYALFADGVETNLRISLEKPFTFEAYVTPSAELNLSQQSLLVFGSIALAAGTEWNWFVFTQDTPRKSVKAAGGPEPQPGVRTHVAGVYTPTELRLYVNGKKAGVQSLAGIAINPITRNVSIGYKFTDMIDEVRVSNTARYDDEFDLKPRFENDPDTLLLYHCDEGSGSVLNDASGHNHTGKITGARWMNADGSEITSPPAAGSDAKPVK